ncbi:MAG: tape measure protein [Thermodesulfobacteriota bacterium]
MSDKVQLIIEVDAAKGTAAITGFTNDVVEKTKSMSSRAMDKLKSLEEGFRRGIGGAIGWVADKLTSLKTLAVGALTGWGLKSLADSFVTVGSSMDQMKLSLDTITKGQGDEWFEKLNDWALKMPINTERAIQSFTMMRAMGLKPSIADMTTLVDTTSALGGQADTLEGIARALGQIQTKGKVSAEELMQLAERGIPVYEILREKLHLTQEDLGNIGAKGIEASTAIAAIMQGLEERFGGQSAKIQNSWAAMVESLTSYWTEFRRLVMDSGVMDWLEEKLAGVIRIIDDWRASGQFEAYAREMAQQVIGALQAIWDYGVRFYQWWLENHDRVIEAGKRLLDRLGEIYRTIVDHREEWALLGKVMIGIWAASSLASGISSVIGLIGGVTAALGSATGAAISLRAVLLSIPMAGVAYALYKGADYLGQMSEQYRLQTEARNQTIRLQDRTWSGGTGQSAPAADPFSAEDYAWLNRDPLHLEIHGKAVTDSLEGLAAKVSTAGGGLTDALSGAGARLTESLSGTAASVAARGGSVADALIDTGAAVVAAGARLSSALDQAASQARGRATFITHQTGATAVAYDHFAGALTGANNHFDGAMYGVNDHFRSMNSYATGTRYVPKTGTYRLHEGEEVLTREQAQAARHHAERQGRPGREEGRGVTIGNLSLTINVPAEAAPKSESDWRAVVRDFILPELEAARA